MTCRCSETQQKSKAELARERVIDLALETATVSKDAPYIDIDRLRAYTELIKALNTW